MNTNLELNIAPITFSKERAVIGVLPYTDGTAYKQLRDKHWKTHAFRYDNGSGQIYNVAIVAGVSPLGDKQEVTIKEHLLLFARGIQRAILVWIATKNTRILQETKPLVFWGQTQQALLLTQAVQKYEEDAVDGLEVAVKYEIDCRLFRQADGASYLGLVIDIATSNLIEIPASKLIDQRFPVVGKFVCKRRDFEHEYLQPRLDILGRVQSVQGSRLILTDTEFSKEVEAKDALLEPRMENLEAVLKHVYKGKSGAILGELKNKRINLNSAVGKRSLIRKTVETLNIGKLTLAGDVLVGVEMPLKKQHSAFPEIVSTDRPSLLFGAQGRSSSPFPDKGVTTYGPFMYMLHERNAPLIVVVCEKRERGRVEQFIQSMRYGYDEKLWNNANRSNPFPDGIIGKYKLQKIDLEYEECEDASAPSYQAAVKRVLQRTAKLPDLAIIQIRNNFRQLPTHKNPYFVSKAAFMLAGVPTQDITIENMQKQGEGLAYLLNNVSLATYAKLDGTPWVIATHRPSTYELVVGLGSTEVSSTRVGTRKRYVGITTMFQGDGMYLVWGLTREVEFEDYPSALLESLRSTIRHVQSQNGWQEGDKIRLICHVYKRLKDNEVDVIKTLVRELLDKKFSVEFAFLDVSEQHIYHIFDNAQQGVPYWMGGRKLTKGAGVPERGLCLQLDERRGLLHLTGPGDIKTDTQGLPQPLLVELHPDSDFTDMTYLLRQIYHFSFMSWRSFFPATQPVTIKYSQLIANLLGNLNMVSGWDSTVLSIGSLRGRRWFL